MLALLLVGSVVAWTVHRYLTRAKRTVTAPLTPKRRSYTTDEWDADEIAWDRDAAHLLDKGKARRIPHSLTPEQLAAAMETTSHGLLCPDYFVTFPVQTGSDVAQVPNEDYPQS